LTPGVARLLFFFFSKMFAFVFLLFFDWPKPVLRCKIHPLLNTLTHNFVGMKGSQTMRTLNQLLLPTPVFFNLFWFTAPYKTEKIWRHPYLSKMPIWTTLSSKKNLKGSKINNWRHPWHLFTAPLCAVAPRLGTTALHHK